MLWLLHGSRLTFLNLQRDDSKMLCVRHLRCACLHRSYSYIAVKCMYSNIFKCCHPTKLLCSAEFGLASPIKPPRMHLRGLNSLGFYTNSEQLCLGLDAKTEDPQAAKDPQDACSQRRPPLQLPSPYWQRSVCAGQWLQPFL